MTVMPPGPLGPRFTEALFHMVTLHARQPRKGSTTPYAAHLLSVAALVLEGGGDEDQAIAALLHDAAEDQGGMPTLENIRERFGARVAGIVEGCTDSFAEKEPKAPWQERKDEHLARLVHADADLRLVYTADKIHNIRDTLRCLHEDRSRGGDGSAVWKLFKREPERVLWYYRSVAVLFRRAGGSPLQEEYERQLAALEQAAGAPAA